MTGGGAGGQINVTQRDQQATLFDHISASGMYLDNGGVLRKRACRLGRFAHSQVLDVAASEDDVLERVISGRDGPVSGSVLGAEGTN